MADPVQNGIFTRTHHDIKQDLRGSRSITQQCVRVCNQIMVSAVQNKTMLIRNLISSNKPAEITLPLSSQDSICHIHLSPTGFHAIVSSKAGENFYVSLKSNIASPLRKIKEQITSVGWVHEHVKDSDTGFILLGTVLGCIYETNISNNGTVSFIKEYPNHFSREREGDQKISEMRLFVVNDEDPKAAKYVLFVCQPGRLYSLCAHINTVPPVKSSYMSAASLQSYVTLPEPPQHIFHPFFNKDCIKTTISMPLAENRVPDAWSGLVFYPCREDVLQPFKFLWIGPDGYTIGKVNLLADKPGDFIEEERHLGHRRIDGEVLYPIGASLTEYHALLAYPHRLLAISLLTYDVVYDDCWNQEFGKALGITLDPVSEYHWLYTSTVMLKYRASDETRYVWRVLLENGDFAKALAVARDRLDRDPDSYQQVLKKQADKFISEKNYTAAAEILAQSTEPFESVVLKFLSTEDDRRLGLKTLLEKKLEKLNSVEDRLKKDALVLWLLEVMLAELAEARRESGKEDQIAELNRQLQQFICKKRVHESIASNKEAVYQLMISHADFDSQFFLANFLKDYLTVINIHLLREQYDEILEILKIQNSPGAFYQYSPILVSHVPLQLFGHLIGKERIRPSKMVSTLCQCQNNKKMAEPAMRYVEWVVTLPFYSHDNTFHNMLVLMYAQFSTRRLHEYLVSKGTEKTCIPYDLDFAIRTCQQYKLEKSLIYLYCVSELFGEAVDKALETSVEFAKDCAKLMAPDDEDYLMGIESKYPKEERRKIWMKIARFVIEKEQDAVKGLELLKESKGAISIQDIFPFFPSFTKIEHYKDALCECLKDHSKEILEIQQSLKEATQTAQEIRDRTDRLKNRVMVIKGGEQCSKCKRALAGRAFYPFACRHFFHRECLEEEAQHFISLESRKRLTDLNHRERRALQQIEVESRSSQKSKVLTDAQTRYSEICAQIDEILGIDCPLCGMMAIDLIDTPFFSDVDYLEDLDSWKV